MSDGSFRLDGKRALVTGGAQGLGRMIAEGLLRAGASVAVISRKPEIVEQAAREMSALGPCHAIPGDLSTPEGVVEAVARYRGMADGLDILVNNAGKTWGAPIETFPDKAWTSIMAVNLQAPFKMIQSLLPELTASAAASDPGRIINIGSAAGERVQPMSAYSYTASKAAIHMLSRQLAAELAGRNITVNAVLPGYFPTSMTAHLRDEDGDVPEEMRAKIPLRRLGRPSDIAGIAVFLASPAGAYITGAEIPVDGGIVGCH